MITILALCTGNASRSILAEAILNRDGGGRVRAFSAGSNPAGVVARATLDCLAARGLPVGGLRSKGWAEFAGPGAPPLDIVLTLCPAVAAELPPTWPGRPVAVDWPMDEPLAATPGERALAFALAYHRLSARINAALALPLERLARDELAERLGAIGRG
ncbi:arsenate reductase ArsC [Limibaculum sp. FT325]|uniref:arsenate reductase/protein-tyrosine-phosphatase family protein n=1 Tax=Thermohalobaculum sediminis TaxID=2939436 RepID=UPI0020BF2F94|nr:arsenate reductase ArsC [Limibaculum sediminis]MCL5775520.1 arsenate reductase ArsC [Limibaculum sediminis]